MTSDQYFLAVTTIQNRLHAYILSLLRTLFVELQENPGHLDQVRVLVEANE